MRCHTALEEQARVLVERNKLSQAPEEIVKDMLAHTLQMPRAGWFWRVGQATGFGYTWRKRYFRCWQSGPSTARQAEQPYFRHGLLGGVLT
jgi:hypothetical protein